MKIINIILIALLAATVAGCSSSGGSSDSSSGGGGGGGGGGGNASIDPLLKPGDDHSNVQRYATWVSPISSGGNVGRASGVLAGEDADWDWFQFSITPGATGDIHVWSTGSTDTIGALWDSAGDGIIGYDNNESNSGAGKNFSFVYSTADVSGPTFGVSVTNYAELDTGPYGLIISFVAASGSGGIGDGGGTTTYYGAVYTARDSTTVYVGAVLTRSSATVARSDANAECRTSSGNSCNNIITFSSGQYFSAYLGNNSSGSPVAGIATHNSQSAADSSARSACIDAGGTSSGSGSACTASTVRGYQR